MSLLQYYLSAALSGNGHTVNNWQKYWETSVKNSDDQSYKDTEQLFSAQFLTIGSEYFLYYNANSQNVILPIWKDADLIFVARRSTTDTASIHENWVKYSDAGGPIQLLQLGNTTDWDGSQQYLMKTIDMGDNTYRMYYTGIPDTPTPTHKAGFATSSDGLNWTKYVSNPIFSGSTYFIPLKDGANWYAITNSSGFNLQSSTDGISWSYVRDISLPNLALFGEFVKVNGIYYIYGWGGGSGYTGNEVRAYSSTDLITFTYLGAQGALLNETDLQNSSIGLLNYDTNKFAIFYTYNKYRLRQEAPATRNPISGIRCMDLESELPHSGDYNDIYPSYVKRFYCISESNFSEFITDTAATTTIGSPVYSPDERYLTGNGVSDHVVFPETSIISQTLLSVKCRVYKNLTGSKPIVHQGETWKMSLETGKLRVILSANGVAIDKQYDSVDNVDIPATARDVYTGAWVGFRFVSGVLKLYINNFEVTTTKTIDNTITQLHNETANVQILRDGSTYSNNQTKNISILSGENEIEFNQWDMF